MKNDVVMYKRLYQILKNKIECGILPGGSKLPSRANLCKDFGISEKTVRRAVDMLVQEGLVETSKRKRPTVAYNCVARRQAEPSFFKKADSIVAADILKTGILLCYPVNGRGMALCKGEEWRIPEAIIENMDPEKPVEFWRLSNRFWRFFISRNENELILRAVDSLGFSELDPLPGTLEIRKNYWESLKKLIWTMKRGGDPEKIPFDDLFVLFGFLPEQGGPDYQVSPDSPMRLGTGILEQRLRMAQERYSSVYMDLLGLITIGRYQPGDRLPSHEELQKIYGVSIDTTIKAVQTLQDWGVLTAVRGKGIFVNMNLEALKKIHLDPNLLACHVRRFLDSLELLSLTVEGVAFHAAACVTAEEACRLYDEIDKLWNGEYLYQTSPMIVLSFITKHIRYDALRAIYEMVQSNYHIGRSIPKLVNRAKTPESCRIYQQCMEAAGTLREGDGRGFAKKAAEMFKNTHRLVIDECKKLEYWEPAMRVYDGTALWR